MIPLSTHSDLAVLASAAYFVLMNRATPCHLRAKVVKFIQDIKADLPAEALKDVEAEEAKAVIEAASYFR